MAPDSRQGLVTVAEVVREAAGIVDPDDRYALVGDFERWFEDDDDPVEAVPVPAAIADWAGGPR